jgi:hypothetical protein
MPRGTVVIGVPGRIEDRDFEYTTGDRAGETGHSISFQLVHPATAMSGSVQMESSDPDVIEAIRLAAEESREIVVAAVPKIIPYQKDGESRTFLKLRAVAVVHG